MKNVYSFVGGVFLCLCSLISFAQTPHLGVAIPSGKIGVQKTRLIDIFAQSDRAILKSKNEALIANYLRTRNDKIVQYLTSKYPQYGVPEFDRNDPSSIMFGLICAMYEANNFGPLKDVKVNSILFQGIPGWLSCTLGVLGASIGITALMESLGTFSYGSVWRVVRFVVKKYVTGWLATAVAVYSIANECF
jgi:hypothetical protein